MDLTLHRQRPSTPSRARSARAAVVPVAALCGASALAAGLLLALSDLVARLG